MIGDMMRRNKMNYVIREMKEFEYTILKKFLYEAIYKRNDEEIIPESILEQVELQIYIRDFGRMKDDYCICAEVDKQIIGAIWVRCIHGYGTIDDTTPELAISLYKEYRNCGIGTALMKAMLLYLKNAGYKQCSLGVQKDNYALNMYRKLGFQIVEEEAEQCCMVYKILKEDECI